MFYVTILLDGSYLMDYIKEHWQEILQTVKIEHDISDVSFDSWLKPLKPHHVENDTLYILIEADQDIDQEMGLKYINRKFKIPIKIAISEITNKDYEIEFFTQPKDQIEKAGIDSASNNTYSEEANLNPKYVFDTFVVGSNNKFAHSACLAVAESPGENYNPLYIYGGPGLGKTHLIQSIGHFILKNRPDAKVIYVTSEVFTNDVIESIRSGNPSSMTKLRDKYRKVDVLMVDDIQFIIGKESTQEEFFHTFNELHSAGKQIILSSDKPPKEMETLEERIKSRFEWGLIADIGSPDYETRMAILRKKQENAGYTLDDEILNYIATHIKSNIRELEGALNKLIAKKTLENVDVTMDIAVETLKNLVSPEKPREVTAQLIIEIVCDHFDIPMDKMISKSRSSEIARPRHIAMYLCKELTNNSLQVIGGLLGGRDHTTIMHGVNKIQDEYVNNDNTKTLIDTLKRKIMND